MKRKIIRIDEKKRNGCGACAEACHEGAIGMVDGKAKLLRDGCCDGMGDCLPECPTGAITLWRSPAAADWKWPRSKPCKTAESSVPGRRQRFRLMAAS